MSIKPCPKCQTGTVRRLEVSKDAWVDYYRCEKCGHVRTFPKDGSSPIPRDVTKE